MFTYFLANLSIYLFFSYLFSNLSIFPYFSLIIYLFSAFLRAPFIYVHLANGPCVNVFNACLFSFHFFTRGMGIIFLLYCLLIYSLFIFLLIFIVTFILTFRLKLAVIFLVISLGSCFLVISHCFCLYDDDHMNFFISFSYLFYAKNEIVNVCASYAHF